MDSVDSRTIPEALELAVRAAPDRTFLDIGGKQYTYAEIDEQTAALAAALTARGVEPGERVAILLGNCLEAVVGWIAANRVGAVVVPLNTSLDAEALSHQLGDSGAMVLLADGGDAGRVLEVLPGLAGLRLCVWIGAAPEIRDDRLHVRFDDLLAPAIGSPDLAAPPQAQDLAALMYTSGTTGKAKACMITHNYLCHAGRQLVVGGQQGADETIYMPLPFFQINAMSSTAGTLLAQGTLCLAAGFDVATFWPEIRRTGATVTALLASMVQAVTNLEESEDERACFGQVRIVRGGPFTRDEDAVWRERFGVQRVGSHAYGSTEVCRMTSVPLDEPTTPGTNGRRNEFYDVRIFDEEDEECPPGGVGEIVCRPLRPHVMFDGYWNRPVETLHAFRNLWFHTGDLGRFDEAGNLIFVDRRKHNLQTAGGLSGPELEAIVRRHPGVKEVAAYEVAWPDTNTPCVALAIVARTSLEAEELWGWLDRQVPSGALPRMIRVVGELPKNQVGRVQKFKLMETGFAADAWVRADSTGSVGERR